jgi:hypothetical protein
VEEEDDDGVVAYLRKQRLVSNSDNPEGCRPMTRCGWSHLMTPPHPVWKGNVEDVITTLIGETSSQLVDLMCDADGARPSGAVKDDPNDKSYDRCGKNKLTDIACRYLDLYYHGCHH